MQYTPIRNAFKRALRIFWYNKKVSPLIKAISDSQTICLDYVNDTFRHQKQYVYEFCNPHSSQMNKKKKGLGHLKPQSLLMSSTF